MLQIIASPVMAEDEAALFAERLKEYSKKMMPIQFDVELIDVVKPTFNHREEAVKYENEKIEADLRMMKNKPPEEVIQRRLENNVNFLVKGSTSTMRYKCKSYDFVNYQIYVFDGKTNNCEQVSLNSDEFGCQYMPKYSQLEILPPSLYTRERLFMFEHERSYNFMENGMRLEKKDGKINLYINENGEQEFKMIFKSERDKYPIKLEQKTYAEHTEIEYCELIEIDGLIYPQKIKIDRYQLHDVTQKLYLKYVNYFKFYNIKIVPDMKKSDLDIEVPPGILIGKTKDFKLYNMERLEGDQLKSVKKEIMKKAD